MWKEEKRDGKQDGDPIMATTYEIIHGLAQAAAIAYDGALGEDYEPVNTIRTVEPLTDNGVSYTGGRLMRWRRQRKAKQLQELRKLTEISTNQETLLLDAMD